MHCKVSLWHGVPKASHPTRNPTMHFPPARLEVSSPPASFFVTKQYACHAIWCNVTTSNPVKVPRPPPRHACRHNYSWMFPSAMASKNSAAVISDTNLDQKWHQVPKMAPSAISARLARRTYWWIVPSAKSVTQSSVASPATDLVQMHDPLPQGIMPTTQYYNQEP